MQGEEREREREREEGREGDEWSRRNLRVDMEIFHSLIGCECRRRRAGRPLYPRGGCRVEDMRSTASNRQTNKTAVDAGVSIPHHGLEGFVSATGMHARLPSRPTARVREREGGVWRGGETIPPGGERRKSGKRRARRVQ
jgi:hypothetical protein